MTEKSPVFALIAGVNGAGKSTFFRTGMCRRDFDADILWINPDDILRELGGDASSEKDQLQAGRVAIQRMRAALDARASFCEETTLSGRSCLLRITEAKRREYRVVLYYLGVDCPQTAQARIAHRVSVGGHNIPNDLVERRYRTSMANFDAAIELCDEVYAFDNTIKLTQWAAWNHGCLVSWSVFPVKENWLFQAISEEEVAI